MKPSVVERLAMRERPEGSPVMYQSWGNLLFMHWEASVEALRGHVPRGLEIDTHEGRAYVGLTPFKLWGVRPVFTPPLPLVSEFREINVRTYVHRDGVPGVWFFSLDADSTVAVAGARALFRLPYFHSRIEMEEQGATTRYAAARDDSSGEAAEFEATWEVGPERPHAEPGSLDFFLVERYCLYTADAEGKLYRVRIHHRPWPLRDAALRSHRSSMVEAAGLSLSGDEPLLHHGGPVDVEVWPLEEV